MAQAVQSHPHLASLRTGFTPSREVVHTIRFAVAVTAAVWLGKAPGLVDSHSTWILITVLMLVQPTGGAALLKSLLRAAGTVVAAFTAIALFGLFSQMPPLLMGGLFLVQAIGAYGFTGTRYQYAWFVWAFTTAIILGNAMAGEGAVETVAFERASMVGIGIVLVYVVESLFWPARAETGLRAGLASSARLLGAAFEQTLARPQRDERAPLPEAGAFASQLALLGAARTEVGASRAALYALERAATLLEALAASARTLATPLEAPEAESFATALNQLGSQIAAALDEIAAAVVEARTPSLASDQLDEALDLLETENERFMVRGGRSAELEARVSELRDVVATTRRLDALLAATDEHESPVAEASTSRLPLRVDPFRMKIALRAGIAVVAALLVPEALGWPTNTMVAPVTFMIAASSTRGGATGQILGLLKVFAIGWLVADLLIVFVAPYASRAPLAMVPVFAVAAAFAYIGQKRPALGALASLGGLVTFLSAWGGTAAATNVEGAYDTVCYMGLALGIGWLSGRLLWPASAAQLFRERLAAHLELSLEAIHAWRATDSAEPRQPIADLIPRFAAQFAQLGPLHDQARHEPVERQLDPDRRARILTLLRDHADAVSADRGAAAEALSKASSASLQPLADALERADEALLASMQANLDSLRGGTPQSPSNLAEAHGEAERRLQELRTESASLPGAATSSGPSVLDALGDLDERRFLAELDARRKFVRRQLALEDWFQQWEAAESQSAAR